MGILDTFFFVFDSDASKLDKGLKQSEKEAEALKKSVVDTDKVADKLGKTFVETAKGVIAAGTALIALGAIKSFTIASAEASGEIAKQTRLLRVNMEEFQLWSGAVVAGGGNADQFAATIAKIGEVSRNPLLALEKLSDRFEKMSKFQARKVGESLGFDQGTIDLLQKGRRGIEEMIRRREELGIVTEEQAKIAVKFNAQLRDTNQVYDDVRRRIATAILPVFTWFLETLEKTTRFLRDNYQFTIAFFVGIAAVITGIYLPAIYRAVVATYTFLAPWLLIGAAIVAVAAIAALVFDDIKNYLDGNISLIGKLAEKWPAVGTAIKGAAEIAKWFFGVIKEGLVFIADLVTKGPQKAFENLANNLGGYFDRIVAKFPKLGPLFHLIETSIRGLGQLTSYLGDKFADLYKIVTAFYTGTKDGIASLLEKYPMLGQVIDIVSDHLQGLVAAWGVVWDVFNAGFSALADLIEFGPAKAIETFRTKLGAVVDELSEKFPGLAQAVRIVGDVLSGVAHVVGDAWSSLLKIIMSVIDTAVGAATTVSSAISGVASLFGLGSDTKPPGATPQTTGAIQSGKGAIAQANSNAIASQSSNAIMAGSNSTSSKNTNVQTGPITIQTQASDGDAINGAIAKGLGDHIKGAIDDSDDGVLI